MNKKDIFWYSYLNLEEEVIQLSKYVFITDEKIVNGKTGYRTEQCNHQLLTFSNYICDLLIQIVVQIESISKQIFFDNGGAWNKPEPPLFDDDCLKFIDKKWNMENKRVTIISPLFNLTNKDNYELHPLKDAHKRKRGWEKSYQAVKHDRFNNLAKGNIKSVLEALSALFLLNIYNKMPDIECTYVNIDKTDFSFGSKLFAVDSPKIADQLWYNNKIVLSESPFVVQYKDDSFNIMTNLNDKIKEKQANWLNGQDEIKHNILIKEVIEILDKEKSFRKVVLLIAKYRANKIIKKDMPFDIKKNTLINSFLWGKPLYFKYEHPDISTITEENIDKIINDACSIWAMDIDCSFINHKLIQDSFDKYSCDIYIPK